MTATPARRKPIIVVGGGVGGLASGLALAQHGYPSIVFESRHTSAYVDRGDILHAGVLPLLAAWAVDGDLAAQAPVRFHRFRIADETGQILLDADTTALLGADRYFTAIRHQNLIQALRAAAVRTGLVDLRDGERCTSLVHDGRRVCGVDTTVGRYEADLTVVATGARSHLPTACFGQAQIHHYGTAFYNACVQAIDGYTDCGYYVLGRYGAMVLAPLPNGHQRVGVQIKASELDHVAGQDFLRRAVAARFQPLAGTALRLLDRPRIYRLQRATRSTWWVSGAVLVGDVAHQVHPVGGQGMNLALFDAEALSHSLAAGSGEPDDIDAAACRYGQHRRQQVRRALRRTHLLGLAADRPFTTGRLVLVRLLNVTTSAKRAVLRSMIDVR